MVSNLHFRCLTSASYELAHENLCLALSNVQNDARRVSRVASRVNIKIQYNVVVSRKLKPVTARSEDNLLKILYNIVCCVKTYEAGYWTLSADAHLLFVAILYKCRNKVLKGARAFFFSFLSSFLFLFLSSSNALHKFSKLYVRSSHKSFIRSTTKFWYNHIPVLCICMLCVWSSVDITISLRSGHAAHHPEHLC